MLLGLRENHPGVQEVKEKSGDCEDRVSDGSGVGRRERVAVTESQSYSARIGTRRRSTSSEYGAFPEGTRSASPGKVHLAP